YRNDDTPAVRRYSKRDRHSRKDAQREVAIDFPTVQRGLFPDAAIPLIARAAALGNGGERRAQNGGREPDAREQILWQRGSDRARDQDQYVAEAAAGRRSGPDVRGGGRDRRREEQWDP